MSVCVDLSFMVTILGQLLLKSFPPFLLGYPKTSFQVPKFRYLQVSKIRNKKVLKQTIIEIICLAFKKKFFPYFNKKSSDTDFCLSNGIRPNSLARTKFPIFYFRHACPK